MHLSPYGPTSYPSPQYTVIGLHTVAEAVPKVIAVAPTVLTGQGNALHVLMLASKDRSRTRPQSGMMSATGTAQAAHTALCLEPQNMALAYGQCAEPGCLYGLDEDGDIMAGSTLASRPLSQRDLC